MWLQWLELSQKERAVKSIPINSIRGAIPSHINAVKDYCTRKYTA
jgi:hypothetical protein